MKNAYRREWINNALRMVKYGKLERADIRNYVRKMTTK